MLQVIVSEREEVVVVTDGWISRRNTKPNKQGTV
jgi:hypothetical protein